MRSTLYDRRDETVTVHFSVRDKGVGIPSDKLDLIFEEFSQADSTISREFGGTGLGLAISSRLVGLMGGQVWVESEVGRGSTLHFTAVFEHPRASEAVAVRDNRWNQDSNGSAPSLPLLPRVELGRNFPAFR